MAHRKPLGTTFTSTFDWIGPPPELHDGLQSKAGTWYRVVGVREMSSPAKIGLTLERVAEPELDGSWMSALFVFWPDGFSGLAHQFVWYPRGRQRRIS